MDKLQLFYNHRFTPELRARLDAYVAVQNERNAPAVLSMRSVVNDAVDEYLTRREDKDQSGRAA